MASFRTSRSSAPIPKTRGASANALPGRTFASAIPGIWRRIRRNLKNIYALSVGIAVGLSYGDNFLAVLIANAAGEMTRFLEESYPDARNTQVSAYLGDLLVTCYSDLQPQPPAGAAHRPRLYRQRAP